MDAYSLLQDLEAKIRASGLNMATVAKHAGIQHSLVSRWKAKLYEPRLSSLRKLEEALADLTAGPTDSIADLL